jgi:hypothetical protein
MSAANRSQSHERGELKWLLVVIVLFCAVRPESGVKSAGFLRKWPKTRGFVKRVVQQSVNFQGIPIGVPMV